MAKDSNPTVWELKPHTKAKHEILRRYLGAWFPIIANPKYGRTTKAVYLDGFAGPGRYSTNEPGSPIIALDTLVTHNLFHRLHKTQFRMVFVEDDEQRFDSLQREIAAFWAQHPGGRPSNVVVSPVHGKWADVADEMLAGVEALGGHLAPTFAFVDPFGFKDMPMATFARLLRHPKSEVFVNFMYDFINRFVEHPEAVIHEHLGELFGLGTYSPAPESTADERRAHLLGLFADQLRVSGCTFVNRFDMIGESGHNTYSLFFGTKNIAGVEKMKDAMWSIDPGEGIAFRDRDADLNVLFEPAPDLSLLRRRLLEKFSGHAASIETIERFVLVDTPYKKSHIKTSVLKPMQREGLIVPVKQARAGQYPPKTVIRFL